MLLGADDQESRGHAMEFLSYPDRLRNALATAVIEGLSSDPSGSFLGGLWRGLSGEKDTSWGDVVGIGSGTPDDDWLTWLLKEGARLGLDIAGDPLNLAFGTGAITKALGLSKAGVSAAGRAAQAMGSRKAADYLASTGLGRIMKRLPEGVKNYDELEDFVTQASREGSIAPLEKLGLATEKALSEILEATPRATRSDVFEAIERRGRYPDLERAATTVDPLRLKNRELFEERNRLWTKMGLDPHEAITEGDIHYLPQMLTRAGERTRQSGRIKDMPIDPKAFDQAHRELFNWVDESGNIVAVGRLDDPRTQKAIDQAIQSGSKEIVPVQASLREKQAITPGLEWVDDPVAALHASNVGRQKQINFLKILDFAREGDYVRHYGGPESLFEGMRQIKVPGIENLQSSPQIATRLENLAGSLYDDATTMGAVGDFLKKAFDTRIGRGIESITDIWRDTTLPLHPGWHTGNVSANEVLMAMAGVKVWDLPARAREAGLVQMGKGADIIEGFTNSKLLSEFAERDLTRGGALFGPEAATTLSEPLKGTNKAKELLGEKLYKPIELLEKGQAKGYKVGSWLESNAMIGTAIDWLKKNAPDLATRGPDEQARLLDQAAAFAKDALLKPELTPLERELRKIIPFYSWQRELFSKTGKQLVERPQDLANLGRVLDTVFQPLPEEHKRVADSSIREKAPVTGFMGAPLEKIIGENAEGLPQMMLLSRYLPHGNVEEFLSRPLSSLVGMATPAVKAPVEMLTDYSMFRDRPIDALAGFPQNLTRAIPGIGGGPYELASQTTFGVHLPAALDYAISQAPGGRYVSEINALGRGLGLWEDLNKTPTTPWESGLYYATGGKAFPYDPAKYMARREREANKTEAVLKSHLKWSAARGDEAAVEHYLRLLEEQPARKAALMGFVEEGG